MNGSTNMNISGDNEQEMTPMMKKKEYFYEKGFVVVNLPEKVNLDMERRMSGYVESRSNEQGEKSKAATDLMNTSERRARSFPIQTSMFDLVISVSVDDHQELRRRLEGRRYDPVLNLYYHLQDNMYDL